MPDGATRTDSDDPIRRPRDAERNRRGILDAAVAEFAENGLSGARVDAIAARADTTVRMIYHYFGGKDGLYIAALEEAYGEMRRAEQELGVQAMTPIEAIRRMVEFVFDYQEAHPEFTRLVAVENIHRAAHIEQSPTIQALNATVIETLTAILERGQREGVFREDVTPVGLHMLITAFPFFRVSNRYTLGTIFGQDPLSPKLRAQHREMVVSSVLGFLETNAKGAAKVRAARREKA